MLRAVLASTLGAFGALAISAAQPALAQKSEFPSQPIRIVAAAPPGGETDTLARLLAKGMEDQLKVPVIVENRPGAGVMVGSTHVARSEPNGYTLLFGGSGLTMSSAVAKTTFDPVKDFTPVSQVANMNFYLTVAPTIKARNIPELVAELKQRPTPANYASSGMGSLLHFQMEVLKSLTGMEAVHVPYKGTAPAVQGILAGDTEMMFATAVSEAHFASGKLRPLAIAMPQRSPAMPDLPTVGESAPGFDIIGWAGLMGPANMPADVVTRLNEAVVAVAADPGFVASLARLGAHAASSTPEALGARLKNETEKYVSVARSLGIEPQ